MTELDQDRIDAELAAARAAKEAAARRVEELTALQHEMRPVWRRLITRRVDNSFGEEYELAMTRRAG